MTITQEPQVGLAVDPRLALIEAAKAGDARARLPKKLSPSRAKTFKQCPQLFFFETIAGIRSGGSLATLRGTIFHYASEHTFDHPQGERTVELALKLVEEGWQSIINPNLDPMTRKDREYAVAARDEALGLVTPGTPEEEELLESVRECVHMWFNMERINNFTPTDLELPNGRKIDGRELYLMAQLAGVTAHGFVDRLDSYTTPEGVKWTITDYKTSAVAPWLKKSSYPAWLRDKIREEAFFQLMVYAVLAWKMFGIKVTMLRLVYVGNGDRETGVQAERVTAEKIEATIADLENIWAGVQQAAVTGEWPAKPTKLCDWCHVKDLCPEFTTS